TGPVGPFEMVKTAASSSFGAWNSSSPKVIDVTAIIQEIVDRAGWAIGQHRTLGAVLAQTGSQDYLYLNDLNGGATGIARLEIDYTEGGSVDLVVASAAHGHTAESPALTQVIVLAVADSGHAHTADNLDLVQASTLAVAGALHAHGVDNLG